MRRVVRFLTAVLLAVALAALVVPVGLRVGPAVVDAFGPGGPDGGSTPAETPQARRPPQAVSSMSAVTELAASAPMPEPGVLAKRLDSALKASGPGGFTGVVRDAITGKMLYDDGGNQPRMPASNTKILTALTVLDALGADHRFRTRVVQGKTPRELILIGGGDVLLAAGKSEPDAVMGHAGLRTLAERTVASLTEAGFRGELTLTVDDTLFTGRPASAVWLPGDLKAGQAAPISPLALNSARFAPEDRYGARPQDPARHVGRKFADALRQASEGAGLTVADGVTLAPAEPGGKPDGGGTSAAGDSGTSAPGDSGAVELAAVQSATVAEQVQLMLETSDNYLAETLSRMAAHARSNPVSFDGSTRTIENTVSRLGVDTTGLVLADSSGLSIKNRISTAQLAAAMRIVVNTGDPDLAAVRGGLPIAGLTGTLSDRYTGEAAAAGAGVVRAKTGTLNEVLALSGYVVTAEGRLLVFSFIGNNFGSIKPANERALDRAAAVLAGCGCGIQPGPSQM